MLQTENLQEEKGDGRAREPSPTTAANAVSRESRFPPPKDLSENPIFSSVV